jgi:hypothetical protein
MPSTTLVPDKGLNRKQHKFKREILKGNSVREAAELSGYGGSYGYHLMEQPKIISAIQVELDKQGIEDEFIVKRIKQGCNAYLVKSGMGGVKKYPDFKARESYIKLVLNLRGDLKPDAQIVQNKQINIVMSPDFVKGLVDSKKITAVEAEVISTEVLNE